MMMPVIRDPACRRAGAIEHCPEDQEVLDDLVYLESAMREQPVVADRGAEASECHKAERHGDYSPVGYGKENEGGDGERVNQYKIKQHPELARSGLPKR